MFFIDSSRPSLLTGRFSFTDRFLPRVITLAPLPGANTEPFAEGAVVASRAFLRVTSGLGAGVGLVNEGACRDTGLAAAAG